MSLADAGLNSTQAELVRNRKPQPVFEYKTRNCLKCSKEFKSQGPSNRICEDCNKVNLRYGRRSNQETSSGHHTVNTPQRLG